MGWSVPLISIWLGVIAAAMAIAGYAAYQTRRRRVSAMQRATAWGSARPRKGEEDQIARYHRMLAEADENVAGSRVGEQEWCDLGMDDLFTEIDRTSGAPGQQLLYHRQSRVFSPLTPRMRRACDSRG